MSQESTARLIVEFKSANEAGVISSGEKLKQTLIGLGKESGAAFKLSLEQAVRDRQVLLKQDLAFQLVQVKAAAAE